MHGQATSSRRHRRRALLLLTTMLMIVGMLPAVAGAQDMPDPTDPRVGLAPGYNDAETAELGIEHIGRFRKQDGSFYNPANVGDFAFAGSDLSFTGNYAIAGNFAGFQIHDISDPTQPTMVTEVYCPGGQGDTTVHGNLLFFSVEETRGQVDCTLGPTGGTNPNRFRGVRVFDISNILAPVQVAAVQTCRGSHTHRLVEDLSDPENVYIYVNGTAGIRSADELAGCFDGGTPATPYFNEDTSRYQIEVIRVPVNAPQNAAVVNEVRLFRDFATGALNGLQNTQPGAQHPCASATVGSCTPAGAAYSPLPNTNTCHDITAYPEIGLAAGACQGNGLLIDISDPANPVRIDAVADVNFSYWHSANFNNDGTKVIFTDEWGGGTGARCTANHQLAWGANALFSIDRSGETPRLVFESYYKMPAPQTTTENCVAHQANILPVPNRDVMVQAWYQGGISMFDFTDPANPTEIAYWDRGPISATANVLGGFWSGYWYNGHVYGAEIARGFDAFEVTPTADLSQNEIDAAKTVQLDEHNAMAMRMYQWDPSFVLARAHVDQLARDGAITTALEGKVRHALDMAEEWIQNPRQRGPALSHLDRAIRLIEWQIGVIAKGKPQGDADRLAALQATIQDLYDSL